MRAWQRKNPAAASAAMKPKAGCGHRNAERWRINPAAKSEGLADALHQVREPAPKTAHNAPYVSFAHLAHPRAGASKRFYRQ